MELSTKRTIARISSFSFIPFVVIVNLCEVPPIVFAIVAILMCLCVNGVFFTAKCKFCDDLLFCDGNGNKGNILFWKFLFGKDPIVCHHCEQKNKINISRSRNKAQNN